MLINAAGRMGDANKCVELLVTEVHHHFVQPGFASAGSDSGGSYECRFLAIDDIADQPFRDGGDGAYVHDDHCGSCGVSCDGAIPN